MRFLGFRLYAPLCSFGDVAVGGQRPSLSAPTRSMVLGLVGACLGISRHDVDGQDELERCLGIATRTDAEGSLLVDYHTAQAPDAARIKAFTKREGRPPSTRLDEVSATFDRDGVRCPLDTQLSQRQYRVDAAYAVCLWLRGSAARWSLETIVDHLRMPRYVPFAGRKGAAIALPFEPSIVDAEEPVAALRSLRFTLDAVIETPVASKSRERTYRWEGEWQGLVPQRTDVRRDRVASRVRWQFLTRAEHVLTEAKEGADVLEHH